MAAEGALARSRRSSGSPSRSASPGWWRASSPGRSLLVAKIVIGATVLAGVLGHVYVLGRRAVRTGATGDLAEHEAGATVVTAG